jgi:hypothetical protein
MIGWPPGNPFQFEVGVHDGAWGVLGFLCIWIGGLFWLHVGGALSAEARPRRRRLLQGRMA